MIFKNIFIKLTLCSFLLFLTNVSFALNMDDNLIKSLPFKHVITMTSTNGESLKDFVKTKIAPFMGKYTNDTGYEICGLFGKRGDLFTIRLGTNDSQIGCLAGEDGFEKGYVYDNTMIHTHPLSDELMIQNNDVIYSEISGSRLKLNTEFQNSPKGFSEDDFDTHVPGFLVVSDNIYYMNGHSKHSVKI